MDWINAYKELPEIKEDGESDLVLCAGRKGTHRDEPDCYVRYELMRYIELENPTSKNYKGEWIRFGWSNRWWDTNPDLYDVEYWMYLPELPNQNKS